MKYWILGILIIIAGDCEDQTRKLKGYEVHGIDVSHYQSVIHWDSIAMQGFQFAFVKATEGTTYADSLFSKNWQSLAEVPIIRGAYHFYRPQEPPAQQLYHYLDVTHLQIGDLPPVLDVELLDGVNKVKLISGMMTWLYLAEVKTGLRPIIYTNFKFYNKFLAGYFDEYPIWIARYSSRKPFLMDERPWSFWQYGNRGRVQGILGDVDLNVFNGTYLELLELCKAPDPVLSKTARPPSIRDASSAD